MSAFWTTPGLEPKRNFKFIMSITGGGGEIKEFLIQKTARPSLETTATEHTYLNHNTINPVMFYCFLVILCHH